MLCMDIPGFAQLADSFVLSIARCYWRPTAYCTEWVWCYQPWNNSFSYRCFIALRLRKDGRHFDSFGCVKAIVQAKFLVPPNRKFEARQMYIPVSSLGSLSWVTTLGVSGGGGGEQPRYHLRSFGLPNVDLLVLQYFLVDWLVQHVSECGQLLALLGCLLRLLQWERLLALFFSISLQR